MSAELVFMMGNFEASFPTDRVYAKNHMWALRTGTSDTGEASTGAGNTGAGNTGAGNTSAGNTGAGNTGAGNSGAGNSELGFRFGLTAYAVRLLQDVYFLDLTIEPGMTLRSKQEIGSIESKKAESSLYTPASGQVLSINNDLINDPTAINLDKYGTGWMFELATDGQDFLPPEAYIEHLAAAWEVAQRTIKGQVNA